MVYDINRAHACGKCKSFCSTFGVHITRVKASPIGAIPPQNGGNVGNAVGIERQKGRAARKRSCQRLMPLTEEDCFYNSHILVG